MLTWELYSYGDLPYGEINPRELPEMLRRHVSPTHHNISPHHTRGERLAQPAACPDFMYAIMQQCWSQMPCAFKHFHIAFDTRSGATTVPAAGNGYITAADAGVRVGAGIAQSRADADAIGCGSVHVHSAGQLQE